MSSVLKAELAFDYFINLSDADLALRTDAEMRAFFAKPSIRGRSLINVHEGGGPALLEVTKLLRADAAACRRVDCRVASPAAFIDCH